MITDDNIPSSVDSVDSDKTGIVGKDVDVVSLDGTVLKTIHNFSYGKLKGLSGIIIIRPSDGSKSIKLHLKITIIHTSAA